MLVDTDPMEDPVERTYTVTGMTCGHCEMSVREEVSEVTGVNGALDATPELVNSDPYGEGWMYELRVSDAAALEALMDVDAYTAQLS